MRGWRTAFRFDCMSISKICGEMIRWVVALVSGSLVSECQYTSA
jgi:hypothetical protein